VGTPRRADRLIAATEPAGSFVQSRRRAGSVALGAVSPVALASISTPYRDTRAGDTGLPS
jgi:hypothetical protein